MSDPLVQAFAEFRDEVGGSVRPEGTDAARTTVRGRKRARSLAVTVAAALALIVPVTAYAAASHDSHGPPPVGASPSGTPETASPSADASPSNSAPPAPDGRISQKDLNRMTLTVPPFAAAGFQDCPSGPVKFTNGVHTIRESMSMSIGAVVYADVDGDGQAETVTRIYCGGETGTMQLVAFDRDASGKVYTLGQLFVADGTVKTICEIRAKPDGSVEAHVGDFAPPFACHEPAPYVQYQWRGYRWNGQSGTQVSGPTVFPPNGKINDISVTASDLVFGPPDGDGVRRGSMSVVTKEKGAGQVPYKLRISLPTGVQLVAPGCETVTYPQPVVDTMCAETGPVNLTFQATAKVPVTSQFLPQVLVMPDHVEYGDPNHQNDSALFKIQI